MDPKRRQYLEAQLSAYLDGELTAAERAEVEDFLAADLDARKLLTELEATAAGLRALPRAKVSPDLMEGLRNRLERQALLGEPSLKPPPVSTIPFGGRWLAAAAVVAMMLTAGYVMWSFRSPEPTLRGRDYALIETAARPASPTREGEVEALEESARANVEEKVGKIAYEVQPVEPRNATVELPAAPPPEASPTRSEDAIAAAPRSMGHAVGSVSGRALNEARPSGTITSEVTVAARDMAGDRPGSQVAKGDEAKSATGGAESAGKPAAREAHRLGDAVAEVANSRGVAAAPGRAPKGIGLADERQRRAAGVATRPAAVQPSVPMIVAQADRGRTGPDRALARGEATAPSGSAASKGVTRARVTETDEKPIFVEGQTGAVDTSGVMEHVTGNRLTKADSGSATERLGTSAVLEQAGFADLDQHTSRLHAGQSKDVQEATRPAEMADHHDDLTPDGFYGARRLGTFQGGFGGMGGVGGGRINERYGRGDGAKAHDANDGRLDREPVAGRSLTDEEGCGPCFLFATPSRGEPPWCPEEYAAMEDTAWSFWSADSRAGVWLAPTWPKETNLAKAKAADAAELNRPTAGGAFLDLKAGDRLAIQRLPDHMRGPAAATDKPATRPASAPSSAPASQPADVPASPPRPSN